MGDIALQNSCEQGSFRNRQVTLGGRGSITEHKVDIF